MAAALPSMLKKEEFKEEFLTCSICSEPYNNDEHKAKCLPCLHTYCQSCLQSIAGKRPHLECPNCRKLVTLPGGSVDSLPHNFLVENLKEYQDIFNLSVSCGGCASRLLAESFCHDCGLFLCLNCIASHRQYGPLQNHKLSTMAELQEQKYNPNTQRQHQCTKHPNQDVTMYCRETNCKVPVCATCGFIDHRGHDLIELSAAVGQVINDLQQSAAKVNDKSKELASKRRKIKKQQRALTTNFKKKEKEMQESTQNLHKQIDASYNKAHSHLKSLYDTEMTNLTANLESVDTLASQMTSSCEYANKSCDMSNPTQLLTSQNQIMERLNELKISEMPEITSDKTDFVFTKKHDSAMAQLETLQMDLFTLNWMQSAPQAAQQRLRGLKQRQQFHGRAAQASHARVPQVDPQQCTIQLGLSDAFGNLWGERKAIIQTVDVTGQKMTTGGAKVEATQDGSLNVQDNNDGTYTFEYNKYWKNLYVRINGTEMTGSPFKFFLNTL